MPQQKDGGSVELAAAAAPVLLYGLRQALTPETPKKFGRGRRPTGRRPRRAFQKGGQQNTSVTISVTAAQQNALDKYIKTNSVSDIEQVELKSILTNIHVELQRLAQQAADGQGDKVEGQGGAWKNMKNSKAKKGKKMYGGEDMALERAMEQEAEMETTEVEGLAVQDNLLDGLGLKQDGGKGKKKAKKAKKGGDDEEDQDQQEQDGGKGKKKAKKGGDDDLEQDGGKKRKSKAKKGGALQLYEDQLKQIAGLL